MNKRQKGVAIVEFALILPFLLLLSFITIEFGRAIWQYNTLTKSVRDAARYLSIQTPGTQRSREARNLMVYGNLSRHRDARWPSGSAPSNVPDPDLADRRTGTREHRSRDQHRHRPDQRLHLQADVRHRVRAAVRHRHVLRHHRDHEEPPVRTTLKSRQSGATAVEFALVLLIFLTFLLAITDFSRMLYTWNAASEATRAGARYAVVCDNTGNKAQVLAKMQSIAAAAHRRQPRPGLGRRPGIQLHADDLRGRDGDHHRT